MKFADLKIGTLVRCNHPTLRNGEIGEVVTLRNLYPLGATIKWHKDNRTDFWYENDIVQCLLVDYGDENGVEYNRQSVAPKRSVSADAPKPKPTPTPTQAEKDAVIYDQQYAFFAAPSIPENCICEILKSTCRYHG